MGGIKLNTGVDTVHLHPIEELETRYFARVTYIDESESCVEDTESIYLDMEGSNKLEPSKVEETAMSYVAGSDKKLIDLSVVREQRLYKWRRGTGFDLPTVFKKLSDFVTQHPLEDMIKEDKTDEVDEFEINIGEESYVLEPKSGRKPKYILEIEYSTSDENSGLEKLEIHFGLDSVSGIDQSYLKRIEKKVSKNLMSNGNRTEKPEKIYNSYVVSREVVAKMIEDS